MNFTIKNNEQFKSIELYFEGKPSEETRNILKSNGFRWHGIKKCWYGFKDAETISALLNGSSANNQEVKQEETSEKISSLAPIRFYYNGIRVNNGELIKCGYSNYNPDEIVIYARRCNQLPKDYFTVENDTDIYTDYFDNDRAILTINHPLYKYAKAAFTSAQLHDYKNTIARFDKKGGRWLSYHGFKTKEECEKAIEELEKTCKNIQPTNADLLKVEEMKLATENAKLEAEQAEQQAEREIYLNMQCNAIHYIEEATKKYPLDENKPYVLIRWSEHPGIGENVKFSFMAANEFLGRLDDEIPSNHGYFKTAFEIYEDGKAVYDGRYDLGDREGDLYGHIRSWLIWNTKHDCFGHEYNEILTIEQMKRVNEYKEALKWLDSLVVA